MQQTVNKMQKIKPITEMTQEELRKEQIKTMNTRTMLAYLALTTIIAGIIMGIMINNNTLIGIMLAFALGLIALGNTEQLRMEVIQIEIKGRERKWLKNKNKHK